MVSCDFELILRPFLNFRLEFDVVTNIAEVDDIKSIKMITSRELIFPVRVP